MQQNRIVTREELIKLLDKVVNVARKNLDKNEVMFRIALMIAEVGEVKNKTLGVCDGAS